MNNVAKSRAFLATPCSDTLVALADCQNVNLCKHSKAIAKFLSSLGDPAVLWAYHNWGDIKETLKRRVRHHGWQCAVADTDGKNALDDQSMHDFIRLCRSWVPNILVLITNDGDYAPLVNHALKLGCRVIVIGRRGCVNHRLSRLLPNDIYYVEDLYLRLDQAA
jgi:hypothetical protein